MRLLMLVSDFAEVMHVQRPEDGIAQHIHSESAEAVPETAARSRFARLLDAIGAARFRQTFKRSAN